MEKMRDSIDFKNMDIAALFRKLLLPTVLGMIFSALFVITDGIFVGKGIGSDALAAVNIHSGILLVADMHFHPVLPVCAASSTSVRRFGTARTFGSRIHALVRAILRFYGPA